MRTLDEFECSVPILAIAVDTKTRLRCPRTRSTVELGSLIKKHAREGVQLDPRPTLHEQSDVKRRVARNFGITFTEECPR